MMDARAITTRWTNASGAHNGRCPKEVKKRQRANNDYVMGMGSFEAVEAKIRRTMTVRRRVHSYPKDAVRRFATEEWRYFDGKPKSR